ncbi:hypothetical protein O3M35_004366 [Rhynocoris fuscipes]|uniref:EIF3j n=1 Tax=Rhynocoris fuscipes TaxID=488301 RepID=A0AAW1CGY8_9HEMI
MDTWDSEISDVPIKPLPTVKNTKWEGEDVEEDVMDSWDQETEEDEPAAKSPPPLPTAKKAKKIGEKFEEKERKKAEQMARLKDEEKPMTAEEKLAEKLKRQKLQEEADLCLAKEVFGVIGGVAMETKEDYDKLREDILKVISDSTKNTHFVNFTEELVHALCIHLSSADIKKIYTWLGNLHIEKSKLEKGEKSKKSKGKGKAKLKLEGDNDYSEYSAYAEDFDDFI